MLHLRWSLKSIGLLIFYQDNGNKNRRYQHHQKRHCFDVIRCIKKEKHSSQNIGDDYGDERKEFPLRLDFIGRFYQKKQRKRQQNRNDRGQRHPSKDREQPEYTMRD